MYILGILILGVSSEKSVKHNQHLPQFQSFIFIAMSVNWQTTGGSPNRLAVTLLDGSLFVRVLYGRKENWRVITVYSAMCNYCHYHIIPVWPPYRAKGTDESSPGHMSHTATICPSQTTQYLFVSCRFVSCPIMSSSPSRVRAPSTPSLFQESVSVNMVVLVLLVLPFIHFHISNSFRVIIYFEYLSQYLLTLPFAFNHNMKSSKGF